MATCLWAPGAVWSYTILDLLTASDHNSGWRHGPDYDGLDPARVIVPTTMELHLLHLRLITRQLRGRIPLLFRRTWTANAVTPRKQNLSSLLLVRSGNIADNEGSTFARGTPRSVITIPSRVETLEGGLELRNGVSFCLDRKEEYQRCSEQSRLSANLE